MSTPILMPKLGESVVEGTVSRWLKAVGETVAKLEPLLEISTDKIDTELPAPASGTLLEIIVSEGTTVEAGVVLGHIGETGSLRASARSIDAEAQREQQGGSSGFVGPAESRDASAQGSQEGRKVSSGRGYLSPVVKRMAADHAIDLDQVQGTGQGGRITRQDLLAHLERQPHPAEGAVAPAMAEGDEILHPLSTMRRAIAQHMAFSAATSPHVTTVFEVDMTAVVRHREAHKAEYAQRGVKLTFTPYFVAAATVALRDNPLANSHFGEDGIVEHKRIHIGVAVAVPGGLLVPVVRDADELTLSGLARVVSDLAERARSSTLSPDDLHGGTFTITNHGVGGSLLGTPIINQPQAAILGVGAIVKRPVVISLGDGADSLLPGPSDAIVIRPMCYLSLSFDHRVLDGATADAFVGALKSRLERWPDE